MIGAANVEAQRRVAAEAEEMCRAAVVVDGYLMKGLGDRATETIAFLDRASNFTLLAAYLIAAQKHEYVHIKPLLAKRLEARGVDYKFGEELARRRGEFSAAAEERPPAYGNRRLRPSAACLSIVTQLTRYGAGNGSLDDLLKARSELQELIDQEAPSIGHIAAAAAAALAPRREPST